MEIGGGGGCLVFVFFHVPVLCWSFLFIFCFVCFSSVLFVLCVFARFFVLPIFLFFLFFVGVFNRKRVNKLDSDGEGQRQWGGQSEIKKSVRQTKEREM